MKRLSIVVFMLLLIACNNKAVKSPTLILVNGKIFTAENLTTFTEAIAITNNTITAVGKTIEIKSLAGDSTQIIDLHGKLVIPGFNDAHIHFLSGSEGLADVELTSTQSAEEVEAYMKK